MPPAKKKTTVASSKTGSKKSRKAAQKAAAAKAAKKKKEAEEKRAIQKLEKSLKSAEAKLKRIKVPGEVPSSAKKKKERERWERKKEKAIKDKRAAEKKVSEIKLKLSVLRSGTKDVISGLVDSCWTLLTTGPDYRVFAERARAHYNVKDAESARNIRMRLPKRYYDDTVYTSESEGESDEEKEEVTLLHAASILGDKKTIRQLVTKYEISPDICTPENRRMTPLHALLLILASEYAVFRHCEYKRARVAPQSEKRDPPLWLTSEALKSKLGACKELILLGANPDVVTAKGHTAGMIAAKVDNAELMEMVYSRQTADCRDEDGYALIHVAARAGCFRVCSYLLENCENNSFSARTAAPSQVKEDRFCGRDFSHHEGQTVFHAVAVGVSEGETPIWDAVDTVCALRPIADDLINVQDAAGNTALHIAAYEQELMLCKEMLRSGASADIKNNRGETPRTYISTSDKGMLLDAFDYFESHPLNRNNKR